APMGLHGLVHPEGELATARAAAAAETVLVVSAGPSYGVDEIAAELPSLPLWQQVYNWQDRAAITRLVERAEASGCRALVATVDAPVALRRGPINLGFTIPPGTRLADSTVRPLDPSIDWRYLEWLVGLSTLPVVVKGVMCAE